MKISVHFLASLIPLVLLFPIYKYWSLAFFIGSFLIDFDHYLWYALRFRKFNLKMAYDYYKPENKKNKELDILNIFHVWEFWFLAALLRFVSTFFFIIFLGLIFHMLLDLIDLAMHPECLEARAVSFFNWLKRHPKRI